MKVLCIFTFVVCLIGLHVTNATSCSVSNRQSKLQQCLSDIRSVGTNSTAFWFGTQYSTRCPLGPSQTADCLNPSPSTHSLFTRLFGTGFDATVIDRFLKVEYTSPAGHYTGCGDPVTINNTWIHDIDPISNLITTPWNTRFLPYLQWASLPGELFTMIMYDAGFFRTHAVYTNVRGNDLSTATAIYSYQGPTISVHLQNLYVFMIFRQNSQLTVPASWTNNIKGGFNFTELKKDWSLTGPIGINWLRVTGDKYAAENALKQHVMNNCPEFVEEELNTMKRPFLPNPARIDVGMTVTYDVKAIEMTLCCSKHKYSHETFDLNPIGNPIYDTYKVSHRPNVAFLKRGFYSQASNFTGDLYTLITIDPDIPASSIANESHPLIHWLVTNIRDGNMSSGDEYVSYEGPQPPDRKLHYYYFLLYKQTSVIPVSSLYSYSEHCAIFPGRCLFSINGLVADKNLTLVGATWMRAITDIYVAFRRIYFYSENPVQWCSGMQGYKGDASCASGLATVVHPSVFVG